MVKTPTAKPKIVKKKNNDVRSIKPYVILAPGLHLGFYVGGDYINFAEKLTFINTKEKLSVEKKEEIDESFGHFLDMELFGFDSDSLPYCCGIIELGGFTVCEYIQDLIDPVLCINATFNRRNITRVMAELLTATVKNYNPKTIMINIVPTFFRGKRLGDNIDQQLIKEAIIKTGLFKLVRSGKLATANVVETWILKDR